MSDPLESTSNHCDRIIADCKQFLETMITTDQLPVVVLVTFAPTDKGGCLTRLTVHGGPVADKMLHEQMLITSTMRPKFGGGGQNEG